MSQIPHWKDRPEASWKDFQFNQPYEKGLKRLKEDVLAKTNFDPATLWQWGTMQAMAVIEILKTCERIFGAEGQKAVYEALRKVGLDVGRQILNGIAKPDSMTEAEFLSFYITVINRVAYASLEDPKIDDAGKISFHILWCPHQDHYQAFDCRVQRYFVQGMLDAMEEFWNKQSWELKFTSTIPAGGQTCHFVMWRPEEGSKEKSHWETYTQSLEKRALDKSRLEK